MVMKGAFCLTADLIRSLKIPVLIEYIKASSYGHLGKNKGDLKVVGLETLDLKSKDVLLVDDIYDSGETLSYIIAKLQEKLPKTLKTLVLLSKNVKREVDDLPDYSLFFIEDVFAIGFGLDYKERFRELPGIYVYREDGS
jgi:hypoxanthine phosphoribosyltransferase